MSTTPIIITPPPPPPPPPPPVDKVAGDGRTDWQVGWVAGWRVGYASGAEDYALVPSFKRWWKSKTLWFSKALVAVGAWVEWLHMSQPVVKDALGNYGGYAIIGIGLATYILRFTTNRGVGK